MRTAISNAMFCRRCRYDLRHLDTPICPECGCTFDPADSKTFFSKSSTASKRCLTGGLFLSLFPAAMVFWAYIEFVVRWGWTGVMPKYNAGRSMPPAWDAFAGPIETTFSYIIPFTWAASAFFLTAGVLEHQPPIPRWLRAPAVLLAMGMSMLGYGIVFLAIVIDPLGVLDWWLD